MKLASLKHIIFFIFFSISLISKCQISIKNDHLMGGIYVFYNNKNCLPCFMKLKEFFTEEKFKKPQIKIYGVILADSIEKETALIDHFKRTLFSYCDSIIIEKPSLSDGLTPNYSSKKESLFNHFQIYSSPAIIIVSDKTYIFKTSNIFIETDKINKSILDLINKFQ